MMDIRTKFAIIWHLMQVLFIYPLSCVHSWLPIMLTSVNHGVKFIKITKTFQIVRTKLWYFVCSSCIELWIFLIAERQKVQVFVNFKLKVCELCYWSVTDFHCPNKTFYKAGKHESCYKKHDSYVMKRFCIYTPCILLNSFFKRQCKMVYVDTWNILVFQKILK